MAPTRVGIIGLSSSIGAHEPGGWCGAAHIPFLRSSSAYQIVAVTGRTIESAKKAIAAHQLPDTIRIHLTAEDIAADPEVDLIVVSLRVEKHFANSLPAVQAGKDIFIEWPFCASTAQAEQLTQLAAEKGARTFVGLEARADRLINKVKQVIADGTIGEVICSELSASSALLPATQWIAGAEYYLEMESGGNDFHTYFGHLLDFFTFTLGEFEVVQGTLKAQYTTSSIYTATGELVNPSFKKTSPDHIVVQGVLQNGVVVSLVQRKPQAAIDNLGLRWRISGTKGEIEVTSPEQHFSVAPPGRKLRVKVGLGEAKDINFEEPWDKDVVNPEWSHDAHNHARMYDAFAKNDTGRYASFESALKTRQLMDEIVRKSGFEH